MRLYLEQEKTYPNGFVLHVKWADMITKAKVETFGDLVKTIAMFKFGAYPVPLFFDLRDNISLNVWAPHRSNMNPVVLKTFMENFHLRISIKQQKKLLENAVRIVSLIDEAVLAKIKDGTIGINDTPIEATSVEIGKTSYTVFTWQVKNQTLTTKRNSDDWALFVRIVSNNWSTPTDYVVSDCTQLLIALATESLWKFHNIEIKLDKKKENIYIEAGEDKISKTIYQADIFSNPISSINNYAYLLNELFSKVEGINNRVEVEL